jgi:hypothetical protein
MYSIPNVPASWPTIEKGWIRGSQVFGDNVNNSIKVLKRELQLMDYPVSYVTADFIKKGASSVDGKR